MTEQQRHDIAQRALNLLAGTTYEDVHKTLVDITATSVGGMAQLAGKSPDEAAWFAELVHMDVQASIAKNWGAIEIMGRA